MSIVFRNKLPAPVFPIEILGSAAGWVQKVAAIKNAPIDYVAVALFATAASMIGPKRRVQAWDGWEEPSIIWAILVGDPSLIKSPSLDPFRDAVRTIERELNVNFEEKKARYEDEKAAADARKEEWKRQVKAADRDNVVPPPMPKEAMEPKQPTKVRVWISDITTEKMARLLGENPDGLVNFRDEIAGLFGSFDKYGGSGSDKSLWLETYGGRPHRYDRVSLDDELLEWAWSGSNQPEPEKIGVTSIQKALHLIDSWVRATLERVFAEASLPKAERNAMVVGRWLLKTNPKRVNARDLRRQPGFPGPKEPKDLDAALEILVDARWLKLPTDGPGRPPGRPRKDYEVNILIYEETAKS